MARRDDSIQRDNNGSSKEIVFTKSKDPLVEEKEKQHLGCLSRAKAEEEADTNRNSVVMDNGSLPLGNTALFSAGWGGNGLVSPPPLERGSSKNQTPL